MKYLAIAFILATSPAFANGCWDCEPPPPPPPPPSPAVEVREDGDSIVTPYARQYFAVCTCTEFRTAWGFETREFREQAARAQCLALREKRQCELSQPDAITPLK